MGPSSPGLSDAGSSPGDESKEGCWPASRGLGLKEPREGKDPGDDNHEMLLAGEGGGEVELLDDGISESKSARFEEAKRQEQDPGSGSAVLRSDGLA